MSRILGLTICKDEAQRYLEDTLRHNGQYFDGHLVYDDQSTDHSQRIARKCGATVKSRSSRHPSFLEDEGMFRWQAWRALAEEFRPDLGDWVFVVDADEFIVGDVRTIAEECPPHCTAAMVIIPEIFGFADDGAPLVRVDRLWGTIHAPRLVRFRHDAQFVTGHLGVPAVPTYAMAQHLWYNQELFKILHYGYARQRDRVAKYERYAGTWGHSDTHVQSIVASDKTLIRWEGEWPTLRP